MILDPNEKVFIIDRAGQVISLSKWQGIYGIGQDKIGKFFSVNEAIFQNDIKKYGRVFVNELLIRVLDEFRKDVGHSVTLNSLNRSPAHQIELNEAGFKTASYSPHIVRIDRFGITGGTAGDVDTSSHEQTDKEVNILLKAAKG